MSSWRHRLFATGLSAISATRADQWLRPLAMGSGVILMFHHVRPWHDRPFAPNRFLEITPEFLDATVTFLKREGFDIIPMDDVPDRLRSTRSHKPFAVLTFDDGYRDNLAYAWPVLKRLQVPWTLFVVNDFANGRGRLWWLELEMAIRQLDRVEVTLGNERLIFVTKTTAQKYVAFDTLHRRLKAGPEEQLRAMIAELSERVGIDPERLVQNLCANWDELAGLANDPDVTIGSHTLTHPIMARHESSVAASEILESKAAIAKRLGRPVRHIAYPHGDPGSAGSREFSLARQSGYETAVTTRPGHLFARHSDLLTALPRLSINGLHQNEAALRALLSGVPFMMLRMIGRGAGA
ncbi:polysaccharide deacetylase family protein [Microvirga alba]|uniref:Chitooligosaccharide deacetylase n=1 Tax=Microvirga alba TaxID=2791025 RepID=A0A931BSI1_9HYPH|nr:polysaccharide deacetylase family protein [Microvirga alba]MBF9234420.1 polysaccharide deacetylase family protein [Microvirga alba]